MENTNIVKTSVKKNTIFQIAYQVLTIITPLITAPYLSRVLGASVIGTQTYISTVASYFVVFAMLGISTYGNRAIAKAKQAHEDISKTFFEIYRIQLLTNLLAFVVYLLFIFVWEKSQLLLYGVSVIYLLGSLTDITWFFQGLEKFQITVTRSIVVKIIFLALIFVLVKSPNDLVLYLALLSGTAFISNVVLWFYLPKYASFNKTHIKDWKIHLLPIVILFIPVLANSLISMSGNLMLSWLNNDISISTTETGYLAQSTKIYGLLNALATAIGVVLLPHISALFSSSQDQRANVLIIKSFKFSAFIASSTAFGIMGVSQILATVFLGNEFSDTWPIIMAMAFSVIPLSMHNLIRSNYMLPKGMDTKYSISVCIGAVVNVSCNLVFIPLFQAFGVAISLILTNAAILICEILFVRKTMPIWACLKTYLPYLAIGIFMFAVVFWLGSFMGLNFFESSLMPIFGKSSGMVSGIIVLLCQMILGAIIFLVLSFFYLKYYDKETYLIAQMTIRRLLKRKKH